MKVDPPDVISDQSLISWCCPLDLQPSAALSREVYEAGRSLIVTVFVLRCWIQNYVLVRMAYQRRKITSSCITTSSHSA